MILKEYFCYLDAKLMNHINTGTMRYATQFTSTKKVLIFHNCTGSNMRGLMSTDPESIPASREAEAVFLFSSNVNDLQAFSPQTKVNPNKLI